MNTTTSPDTSRAAFTVEEAAQMLGLEPPALRALIRSGSVPATRVGRRWFVPAAWLESLRG